MDKIKVMGFHQPSLPLSLMTPIPKGHSQIAPHIHQKVQKGYRNDYIEESGAIYLLTPLRRTRVKGPKCIQKTYVAPVVLEFWEHIVKFQ